jgi:L-ascorbate metabolism protein UlaG (beta-lactamase superfamily)
VPVRHWGARIVLDDHRGYNAFLIESPDARVLYGGDSAHHTDWRSIGEQGGVDLAVVGIGAYDPWIGGHANPEQAWSMAMDAGARRVLPMHHSTFKLSVEPRDDPLRRFLIAAGERAGDVVCRRIGETWRRA